MFGHPAFGYMIALDRLEERRGSGRRETRPGKSRSVRLGSYRFTFGREGF